MEKPDTRHQARSDSEQRLRADCRPSFILVPVGVKALLIVWFAAALSCYTAAATPPEARGLGLLTNYYLDCPAQYGPQAGYLRSVIKRALHGDHTAMRRVVRHRGLFSTGDNEGYSEVPQALLRTLGDDRYAAFVISQPRSVQEAALAVDPDQIQDFALRFPKTAKLCRERMK